MLYVSSGIILLNFSESILKAISGSNTPTNKLTNYFFSYFYNALVIAVLFGFTYYLYLIAPKSVSVSKGQLKISSIISAVNILLLTVFSLTGVAYVVNPDNYIRRGPVYFIISVLMIAVLFLNFSIITQYGYKLDKRNLLSLHMCELLPIVAILLFYTFNELNLLCTAISLSTIMLFINMQGGHLRVEREKNSSAIKELEGVGEAFTSVFRWNAVNHTFEPSILRPEYSSYVGKNGLVLESFIENVIFPADRTSLRSFLSLANINELSANPEKIIRELKVREITGENHEVVWRRVTLIHVPKTADIDSEQFVAFQDITHEVSLAEKSQSLLRRFIYSSRHVYHSIIEAYPGNDSCYNLHFDSDDKISEVPLEGGWSKSVEEFVNTTVHPDDRLNYIDSLNPKILRNADLDAVFSCTYRSKRTGGYRWYTTTANIIVDQTGRKSVLYLIRDVDDNIRERLKLKDESEHDRLTYMFNRTKYENMLATEYKNLKSCGVIFFDVNNLKKTNDVHGHEIGDELLCKAADSIRSVTNQRIHGYRMGGDEFVIIVADCKKDELQKIIKMWDERLTTLNDEGGTKCTIAYGTAYGDENFSIDELIKVADERMYQNKKLTKNARK